MIFKNIHVILKSENDEHYLIKQSKLKNFRTKKKNVEK